MALTHDLDLPADLAFEEVAVLPPHARLGERRPLAGLAEVSLGDLADEPMVLPDLPLSAEYGLFARTGLRPVVTERTRDMAVLRGLVANGFGYAIAKLRQPGEQAPDGRPLRAAPLSGEVGALRLGALLTAGTARTLRGALPGRGAERGAARAAAALTGQAPSDPSGRFPKA